jgi:hypothetical protein
MKREPEGTTNLLEAFDNLANILSHFRQFLGLKNQSSHSSNDN